MIYRRQLSFKVSIAPSQPCAPVRRERTLWSIILMSAGFWGVAFTGFAYFL